MFEAIKKRILEAASTVAEAVVPSKPSEEAGAQLTKAGLKVIDMAGSAFQGIWSALKTGFSFVKASYNFVVSKIKKAEPEKAEQALGAATQDLTSAFNNLKDTGYYVGETALSGAELAGRTLLTGFYGAQAVARLATKNYFDAQQEQQGRINTRKLPAPAEQVQAGVEVELADVRTFRSAPAA